MRLLSIYFVILAFLSFNPWLRPDSSQAVDNINIAWDKIDHAAAYCLLSLLFMSAYRYHKQQWAVTFMVLLTSSLVGVLFEYCQFWFTSTRQFSYHDAIANVVGAVLGVILFWCYSFVAVKRVSQRLKVSK
jgi:VanZ family protein